jgi:hypothetical protein
MLLGGNQHNTVTFINLWDILAVAVSRNDTSNDTLQQASHLPGSRPSLRMTKEAFLSNDGDSVTGASRDGGEYVVPDTSFVFLLY